MQAQKMTRQLSPYEKNHLRRYGISESIADANYTTPVEYLSGRVDFFGLEFQINPFVLIPRPETEELTEKALEWLSNNPRSTPHRVIDVGTGCGAIAISLALKSGSKLEIIGSDISNQALAIAQANAIRHNTPSIQWIQSDVLKSFPPAEKFDLIIANLPYIPTDRISYLDSSVKDHEPILALDGGPDGLKHIRTLFSQAEITLAHSGSMLLEIDYTHGEALKDEFGLRWKITPWKSSLSQCMFAQCWPTTNNEHP